MTFPKRRIARKLHAPPGRVVGRVARQRSIELLSARDRAGPPKVSLQQALTAQLIQTQKEGLRNGAVHKAEAFSLANELGAEVLGTGKGPIVDGINLSTSRLALYGSLAQAQEMKVEATRSPRSSRHHPTSCRYSIREP